MDANPQGGCGGGGTRDLILTLLVIKMVKCLLGLRLDQIRRLRERLGAQRLELLGRDPLEVPEVETRGHALSEQSELGSSLEPHALERPALDHQLRLVAKERDAP